jgi:hypothetical protein
MEISANWGVKWLRVKDDPYDGPDPG